jgi:glutathione synthase
MKIAFLIDPLATLKPDHDTSLALMHAAIARGWECVYFTQNDLFCRDGQAFAAWHRLDGTSQTRALSTLDVIFMRQDPPVDTEYVYAVHALALAEQAGVLVLNSPRGLREVNEKMFALHFPQCIPPTLVTSNMQHLQEFWQEHRHVVFKPLDGMGGKGVFVVDERGLNLGVILETLTHHQAVTIMAQRYLPDINTQGDKRILLIAGQPLPVALARFPKAGESRGNLAAGGHGQVVALTARDQWICEQVAPSLRDKGLFFVGIDVIGDYLTEINVTSPTCLVEIAQATGLDIASMVLDALLA